MLGAGGPVHTQPALQYRTAWPLRVLWRVREFVVYVHICRRRGRGVSRRSGTEMLQAPVQAPVQLPSVQQDCSMSHDGTHTKMQLLHRLTCSRDFGQQLQLDLQRLACRTGRQGRAWALGTSIDTT